MIQVQNREVHYRCVGSGPTMILLHGFGGSHLDWDLVAKDLSKNFRIVLPTLSNHLLDLQLKMNFDQLVDFFGDFVGQLSQSEQRPIILGGASFGAALSWGIAIRFPHLIESLILVSPMPPNPGERMKDFKIRQLLKLAKFPKGIAAFLMSPMGRFAVPYLENIFQLPWAKAKKRRKFAFLTDRKVKVISHSIARFNWIITHTDWFFWESRLQNITQPTLVLWGDHDSLFGEKELLRFSQMIPNSELRTVIGGGHAMTRESPGAIVREMRSPIHNAKAL